MGVERTLSGHHPRVVFANRYYDPDQSATSQLLTDLGRGLAARGFEVHVVCSRQLYDDPGRFLVAREQLSGVTVHRVATTRFGRANLLGRAIDYASFYVVCGLALWALLRRGDVLVAKTDPPLLSLLAAPLARAKHAGFVNWQQDVFPEVAAHLGANPLPRWLDHGLRHLRDISLRSASMNVVIGARMSEYMRARGVPDAQRCIIENWADDAAISPKPTAASALRTRLRLAEHFVIGYSGNLGRAHEFDTLLGAAEELRHEPKFVFLMIGGGAKMDALKSAVAGRALENFRFLPYQPRETIADSLAAADVHLVSLLPSLEGLIVPSKLYGILAAGRPVIFIGDPDGEIGRIIERGACGRSVNVGDSAGLSAVLRAWDRQPEALSLMGIQARKLLCAEYGLERALDRWANVLDVA